MIQPIGKLSVPTAGTPVSVWSLLPAAFQTFKTCQGVLLQATFSNTGKVYVGNASLNKTTLANCGTVLAIPTAAGAQSFGASNPLSPAGVDLTALYLDADVSGEGVLCTLLVT